VDHDRDVMRWFHLVADLIIPTVNETAGKLFYEPFEEQGRSMFDRAARFFCSCRRQHAASRGTLVIGKEREGSQASCLVFGRTQQPMHAMDRRALSLESLVEVHGEQVINWCPLFIELANGQRSTFDRFV
jgi:hypothetical protein